MIRINLLPVREARRAANMRQQALLLGGAIGIAALTCVWMHVSIKGQQADEQRRIAEAQVELKSLDATRKKVEQFRKEKEEIERKLQVIATLENLRTRGRGSSAYSLRSPGPGSPIHRTMS